MDYWPVAALLLDSHGKPIHTREAWEKKAQEVRGRFRVTIGATPASQRYWGHQVLGTREAGLLVIQTVRVQVDVNEFFEAYVLTPKDTGKLNGRVALASHQTCDFGKEEVAGLAGEPDQQYGKELALRGWTVVAIDHFTVRSKIGPGAGCYDTAKFYARFPAWSAVGKSVLDLQVTLDMMEQLEATKGKPVTAIGHSLGGFAGMFLGAVDDRVAAVVNNGGYMPFSHGVNRAEFFGETGYVHFKHKGLKESVVNGPRPMWDFHELTALMAPRRCLVIGAGNDENVQNHECLALMCREVYGLYAFLGAEGKFACVIHGEGHNFRGWQRAAAYGWMEA